jgi:hypothetical protein
MHWSVLLISISHIPTSGGCNGLFYGVSIPNVPSPEDTLVCFTGFQLPCTYGRGIHFHEQYNKYICLILSSIYIFIPVSGWVVRDPRALLCPQASASPVHRVQILTKYKIPSKYYVNIRPNKHSENPKSKAKYSRATNTKTKGDNIYPTAFHVVTYKA